MKFTLVLCISLLFSMFHAAAMPISNIGKASMGAEAPMMDHKSFHCDNMMQDDLKVQQCCFGVALQTASLLQLTSRIPQRKHDSLSLRLVRHISEVLIRPPKFHPTFIG